MKKSRIAFLLCLLMICATMLSACGAGGAKWEKVLDGSLYETSAVPTQKVDASALANKNLNGNYGNIGGELIYFTNTTSEGDTVYNIYNILKNEIIFTRTKAITTDYTITVGSTGGCAYFVVETRTCNEKNGEPDWSNTEYQTTLYDANATEVAKADKEVDVISSTSGGDFFVFDKTYFLVSEDTGFVKAFEKDPLGKSLSRLSPLGDSYYVELQYEDPYNPYVLEKVIFYDKDLKVVFAYTLPSYAELEGYGMLSEDKVLIQYTVEVDPYSDKYDILDDGDKYDLYTMIYNLKNGKAKEVECDYIINNISLFEEIGEYFGFKAAKNAFCTVYPIVDKRVDTSVMYMATVSEKGKIELFETLEGFAVSYIHPVNTNRWLVDTDAGVTYLVNEQFKVIGDVTNLNYGNFHQKYIDFDGKLYDYDLNVVLDYAEEKLVLKEMFDTSVLFQDKEGYYHLFYNGQKTQITFTREKVEDDGSITKVPQKSYAGTIGADCYGIYDYSDKEDVRYRIFNSEGKELANLSVGKNVFDVSFVYSYEDQMLIKVTGWDSENSKNTYTYYVIK